VISIYELKPGFQRLLQPLLQLFIRYGISPNQITIATMLLSILMGTLIFIFQGSALVLFFLPIFLLIRMGLNALDGMLAKKMNLQSKLGEYLNELCDVVSDTCIFLSFLAIEGVSPFAIIMITVFSVISEMSGVIAVQIGASRRFDGPMGKSDRAFVFGAIAICLACGLEPGLWLSIILWLCLFLIAITIVNRMIKALKEV